MTESLFQYFPNILGWSVPLRFLSRWLIDGLLDHFVPLLWSFSSSILQEMWVTEQGMGFYRWSYWWCSQWHAHFNVSTSYLPSPRSMDQIRLKATTWHWHLTKKHFSLLTATPCSELLVFKTEIFPFYRCSLWFWLSNTPFCIKT